PGEVAGTLLLGGFRGLACDLLWMRAMQARDTRRTYESVALAGAITRIQPRFVRAWEHLAWDQAFNLAADEDDPRAKLGWMEAGVRANAEGCLRNPGEERLLRHLAWMFFNRISYIPGAEERDWAPLVRPAATAAAALAAPDLGAIPDGESPYRLAARLYRIAVATGDARGRPSPEFALRLVPIALEREGDRLRNRLRAAAALHAWCDAIAAWDPVRERIARQGDAERAWLDRDSLERNEPRLWRKAAALAAELDPGSAAAAAFAARDLAAARAAIAALPPRAPAAPVVWLDEP
ncbi:MAG: hypothetical protein RLZZ127_2262, partial [Planctomycetota bacterium]